MKRFCDTDRWIKDVWFCELEPRDKLFWMFILDQCDNVGVWEVNMRIANILTGYDFKEEKLLAALGEKIHVFADGKKWWIPSFIDFQHGILDPDSESKPIKSYISLLEKHTLWKLYVDSIYTVQGKGKGKGKVNTKKVTRDYTDDFEAWWKLYKKGSKADAFKAWNKQKMSDVSFDLLEAVTEQYKSYCSSMDRPLKDGQGWLNSRFFEDTWTHDAQGTMPVDKGCDDQQQSSPLQSKGYAEGGNAIRKNPDGTDNEDDVRAFREKVL